MLYIFIVGYFKKLLFFGTLYLVVGGSFTWTQNLRQEKEPEKTPNAPIPLNMTQEESEKINQIENDGWEFQRFEVTPHAILLFKRDNDYRFVRISLDKLDQSKYLEL